MISRDNQESFFSKNNKSVRKISLEMAGAKLLNLSFSYEATKNDTNHPLTFYVTE